MLTFEEAHEWFAYEPLTGELTWRKRHPRCPIRIGTEVGAVHWKGYRRFCFRKRMYFTHRVAWLMMYGDWPKGDIDHINGDRQDNRIENLRDVSRAVNLQNQRKASKNSKLGVLGVCKRKGKFQAQIWLNNVNHYLGLYNTAEEAHAAYMEAKERLHKGYVK